MIIAWQNASSRFNRALRIPSQNFWKRRLEQARGDDRTKRPAAHDAAGDEH
jgi:hypothetical protein